MDIYILPSIMPLELAPQLSGAVGAAAGAQNPVASSVFTFPSTATLDLGFESYDSTTITAATLPLSIVPSDVLPSFLGASMPTTLVIDTNSHEVPQSTEWAFSTTTDADSPPDTTTTLSSSDESKALNSPLATSSAEDATTTVVTSTSTAVEAGSTSADTETETVGAVPSAQRTATSSSSSKAAPGTRDGPDRISVGDLRCYA